MKKYLLLLVVTLFAASCTVYHPQLASVPLMTHKGEAHVGGGLESDMLLISQLNVDGSYAVSDHVAVQGLFGFGGADYYYGQLAIGAFFPFENHSVVECYLGGGRGHGFNHNIDSTENTLYRYTPIFLQVNYGWADLTAAHIDVGCSLKGGVFPWNSIKANEVPDMRECDHDLSPLLEPQLFFRIGGEHVKLQLQAGYTLMYNLEAHSFNEPTINIVPLSASLGAQVHLREGDGTVNSDR